MKNGNLGVISMSNVSLHEMIINIELLFDLVFKHHPAECQHRTRFKVCITQQYHAVVERVRQRSDFTDNEILTCKEKLTYLTSYGMIYVVRMG